MEVKQEPLHDKALISAQKDFAKFLIQRANIGWINSMGKRGKTGEFIRIASLSGAKVEWPCEDNTIITIMLQEVIRPLKAVIYKSEVTINMNGGKGIKIHCNGEHFVQSSFWFNPDPNELFENFNDHISIKLHKTVEDKKETEKMTKEEIDDIDKSLDDAEKDIREIMDEEKPETKKEVEIIIDDKVKQTFKDAIERRRAKKELRRRILEEKQKVETEKRVLGIEEEEFEREVPESELRNIYDTIDKQLAKDNGKVKIYGAKGKEPIVEANTKVEALRKLRELASQGKISYIGSEGDEVCMVSFKKTVDNLPAVEAELLRYMGTLNPNNIEDQEIIYEIKDLAKRGFKSDDYQKIAKKMLSRKIGKKISEFEQKSDVPIQPSKLHKSIQRITIEDIDKMKEYLKNR